MAATKILIVEDEMIVAEEMADALRLLGYQVPAIVPSGEQAIQIVAKLKPDLVLMDINLQGDVDGIEAADSIRDSFQIPIVFLTAYSDTKTLERAKATEPFGYLLKPFEERELQTTIEIALRRNEAEVAIRNALEKEKEISELKTSFISMVSHDFRDPLTTIQMSIELMRHYKIQGNEQKQGLHFQRIQTAIDHMTNLLDDVLLVGRAESGKLALQPEPIDLDSFCKDLVEELQLSDKYRHPIFFDCRGSSQGLWDEKILRQLLVNLLSNALKYSPQGSPVRFELAFDDDSAVFKVRDSGIGIPPEDQKKLFDSFHRGCNVGKIPGTGLGLTIVKRCVEVHCGRIALESKVGAGTAFTIVLPVSRE